MYPNPNDVLRNPPEDDKKYFGKPMPTNNQEKWEERFESQFHYLRQIFHDGLSGKESEEEEMKSLKSFIRQEIRQANREGILEGLTRASSAFGETAYPQEAINQEISNLKNNDNTTKN